MYYYGGHSADLLFHIIISELQYIILDSPPKKNLGTKYIIWVRNIFIGHIHLLGCIYLLGRVYLFWARLFILSAYAINMTLDNAPWLSAYSNTHLSTSPTDCHLSTYAAWPLPILEQSHALVLSVPRTVHKGISVYSFRDRMGTLTEALERYLRGKANVCVLLDTELTCLQLWPLCSEFPYLLSRISN